MSALEFTRTKAAVAVWRAQQHQLEADLAKVQTNEEFAAWERREKAADDALRDAFFEDTKDRNSRSSIAHVAARDIVRLAETGSW